VENIVDISEHERTFGGFMLFGKVMLGGSILALVGMALFLL
jgi:hypothetical protein